jgi:hypothetical protein
VLVAPVLLEVVAAGGLVAWPLALVAAAPWLLLLLAVGALLVSAAA